MHIKIFASRNRHDLEEQVNQWLSKNAADVALDMTCKFQQSVIDDEAGYRMEYTLILFYYVKPVEEQ